MKIKIWTAVTDGGDGEHHSHTFKSEAEMISDLGLTEYDGYGGMDEYGYYVHCSHKIFDTDGYEVVE